MRAVKWLLLLIFSLPVTDIIWAAQQSAANDYRFGVFPYLSAVRMDQIYAPVSDELSTRLPHQVKFRTSSTFNKFLAKLKAEYYDLALIQPFWYPVAVDEHGYIPLMRMQEPFVSLIMVLDDSPIHSVAELKGKVIATPPAFVPVVHMARRALIKQGLIPGRDVEFLAFKSVDSCFQQVLIGKAHACVAPPFAPAVFEQAMKVKFRTVLESPGIPNLALVIHPRVPEKERQIIRDAILSWSDSQTGRQLLKNMQTRQFIPIDDQEYDVVRQFLKELKN